MKLTGVSEKVFLDRYSLKDKSGSPIEKSPEEMWKRVSHAVSQVEKGYKNKKTWETRFYDALIDFKYVPGGRILAGAGTGYQVTYYNCFVIPSPKDSRGGIMETLTQMIEIMAHGGGVGINLSSLRPRGARVKKVNGFSSGPCNWAEMFSLATKDIIQQGGSRRGALMLMMWDWHPDIEEFITVKQDLTRINGANLSVCVSDKFMTAVKRDEDWDLVFPDKDDPEYDEIWNGDLEIWKKLGKSVIVHKTVKARKIWDLVSDAAWRSAEPGVVFMERVNKLYSNWYWNRVNCVNPCGEEPLPEWGVCNLGSINLSAFINSNSIDEVGEFDYDMLRQTVHTAVRFQDNVIDMDPYIFQGIKDTQLNGERRIGLGTMGLGDTLIKMHMRYGSEEALKIVEKIYRIIRDEGFIASVEIAKEKGAFPKFDKKLYPQGKFIKRLPQNIQVDIAKHGVRNSLLFMQAPTGSTSLMATASSGIEPVYEFEFVRRDRLGKHIIRHHLYDEWFANHKAEIETGEVTRPEWFVSANDLIPEDHVKIQATIQYYVDASISKTVNAPKNHTVDDVKKLYNLAYDLGCKGVAYMREGSRPGVLEREDSDSKKKEEKTNASVYLVKPRPMVVSGSTYKIKTPVGTAFVTVNTNGNQEPLEVFINVGKAGSDVGAMAEGLGRMISVALRFSSHLPPHARIKEIVHQLSHIGGAQAYGFGKERVRSLPDAIAKVLAIHYNLDSKLIDATSESVAANGNGTHTPTQLKEPIGSIPVSNVNQPHLFSEEKQHFDICPECGGASLVFEEGCKKCYSCGYSAC
ncbi:ribonucleoside-diphosphate reductase, adenosylcobalamin-dependent [Candidatus Roizmanbacteria bacterium RIFCSPHIGHO2_01_FULL_39_12b]|uniref:Vitamin B12-dependent ribonucleotide reductase n=1 Tax=Candidatus Roizmanbacteria bacterium RIFCSPHIGHO2_01_FULL_39_12b TaxID=1802030 RepID=A0A1F7G9B3_9BACT|nr:MAG: ribonucleoside-diphosphate reductase, adenosylcobalamin-dependent [Candidatus Roizmanbacteria bacterium RIFCSPHIGHO2_01_FULL_39_12b]OGK46015.1 MAG: ribonucleoside-diphosphate reductase, adenosylcobalamin-dependent [Candidatus Roizmanbacteria bacterium RIFCSPLOWO2_01_FULL_39_19]